MANYLATKRAMPILIPDLEDEYLAPFLAELDGFVLQGGADLAPETYGEKPIGHWKGDAYRDAYELKIMDFAMKHEKPILGICRGAQLMNVYFGGTLYQDIPSQQPKALTHRDGERYDRLHHEIEFMPNSLLAKVYANEPTRVVNSVHHQAMKKLGKDLVVEAISPKDGIIEAISWTGAAKGKVYGVQWHPEFSQTLGDQVLPADALYNTFLEYCILK